MKKNNLTIDLQIITPEKVVCEENVYQVTLPVVDGEVTILPKHRSYIAALKPGEIIYKKNKGSKEEANLAIAG
ncbi:MAG: F0F1 ATP synthase subunit epsilon, partial [Candidatus Moranbacteria bacterium]|nr:F0F1 ATP synthase subunit epsilon [Candidatus Moranbacteria bacterium]